MDKNDRKILKTIKKYQPINLSNLKIKADTGDGTNSFRKKVFRLRNKGLIKITRNGRRVEYHISIN